MTKYFGILILILIAATSCEQRETSTGTINPLLGDISYVKKYGTEPAANVPDKVRIGAHLEYVQQLLAQKSVDGMSTDMQQNRKRMLYLLHEYRLAERYPVNYDHRGQRKPCFIDKDGNICAVGYLVAKTAGMTLAEKINSQYKYAEIMEMKSAELLNWVAQSGLTMEECAMIQPTYGSPNTSYTSPAYGVGSAVWSGANISLTAFSSIQAMKGSNSKLVPALGIISGAGQIVYGALGMPKAKSTWGGDNTNEGKKAVCFINIGIGTTSVLLNTFNLLSASQKKNSRSTVSLFTAPAYSTEPVAGLTYTRRL